MWRCADQPSTTPVVLYLRKVRDTTFGSVCDFLKRARLPKKSFRLKDCLDLITARYFETTSRVVPVPVCDRISAAIAFAGLSHSAPFFLRERARVGDFRSLRARAERTTVTHTTRLEAMSALAFSSAVAIRAPRAGLASAPRESSLSALAADLCARGPTDFSTRPSALARPRRSARRRAGVGAVGAGAPRFCAAFAFGSVPRDTRRAGGRRGGPTLPRAFSARPRARVRQLQRRTC